MSTDHPTGNADNAKRSAKRRSWTSKYIPRPSSSGSKQGSNGTGSGGGGLQAVPSLETPKEGEELTITSSTPLVNSPSTAANTLSRTSTIESPPVSRPSTPKRWSTALLLTPSSSPKLAAQDFDQQGTQLVLNALERTNPQQQATSSSATPRVTGSFGKMSFTSMMGGLSSLSLSRTNTKDSAKDSSIDKLIGGSEEKEPRGRSMVKGKIKRPMSASQASTVQEIDASSRSRSRARSQSPFSFRRFRNREPSPTPQPILLAQSDTDLSDVSTIHPRSTSFTDEPDSCDELPAETDAETEDEGISDNDFFDPLTEFNTERNAHIVPEVPGVPDVEEPDPLGEGVNVVVPHEPYFPSTLISYNSNGNMGSTRGKRASKRRKAVKHHEPLPCQTSRPVFQRDRCTITIKQGEPEVKLANRKRRRYMVASDLSEESRYAVEWGIGTVLRDGDEMLIVTIMENESKADPPIPNAADRALKLRSQQERQGLAYILVRQATSLLQRTKLNVTVPCQAWHAKSARHILLDIADYYEPTMLIVGSRGLGQLSGILLGSTSHYLIQKCSVPVMVARRRLKRPPRKSAHLSKHRTHVSLAEAAIDKVAAKVDADVKTMRDEMQREGERREGGSKNVQGAPLTEGEAEGDEDAEEDVEDEGEGEDDPREIQVV
ncbi:hypothetical protein AX17_005027 [Amanita inopinata Kibby_2008]|nr:hypothetical protein AX17_005027 [Amanita inopinata Kibby_2008]